MGATNAVLRGQTDELARQAEAAKHSEELRRENAALREVAVPQRQAWGLAASEAQLERERAVALAQAQEREAAALREQQARVHQQSETQSSGVPDEIRILRSELEEQK
eukprot:8104643-Alexandrium_andersonii.AAC.1